MKLYIRGFSQYRDKIYDKLSDCSEQLDEHIIRLLLYPGNHYTEHWMHEVWAFLHTVDKLKGKNRYPKADFIYNALACHNDILHHFVKSVKTKESQYDPISISIENITDAVEEYQKWAANLLSSEGYIDYDDVQSKLNEIMKKYIGN